MKISVRAATLKDLDELVRIEQAAFDPQKYPVTSRRQFYYLLTKGVGEIWTSIDARGRITGHIVLFFSKRWRVGRLYSIAVDPEFQGGNIGKALFAAAEKRCIEKGLEGILLEIRSDNGQHKNRYIQAGYKVLSLLPEYYPDGSSGLKMGKGL